VSNLFASANGLRSTSSSISIPYYGLWVADVELAPDAVLAGSVELQIGNLTMRGAVLRTKPFAGSTSARIIGGAGGWGKTITLDPYRLASGVPLSLVLRDAARACGETVKLANDRNLGEFFTPERGPAGRLLRQLGGEQWWIDTSADSAGVTQVGPRPTSKIKSAATVADYSGGKGWLSVATEDLAAWVPGATFSGNTVTTAITVGAVRIASGEDGVLRLEVLTT
jgi:hypothetical protein